MHTFLGEGTFEDTVDRTWQTDSALRSRRDGLVNVRRGLLGRRAAFEGPPAREELVRDHSEPVDVARVRRRLASCLLGRQVARRPENRARNRHPHSGLVDDAGNAEVAHMHLVSLVEEEVRRLDVPVDDSGLMRVVQGGRGLLEPAKRFLAVNRPFTRPLGHCSAR